MSTTPDLDAKPSVKNGGGPAFPTQHNVNDPRSDGFFSEAGMTLRDWFAGKALCQFSDPEAMRFFMATGENDRDRAYALVAEDCYVMADAMLKARAAK